MNRKLIFLFALLVATPLFADTQRYMIATKKAPARTGLRVVSNSADAAKHRVRTFANINAFSADLTAEEAAALRASGEVDSVEPAVLRHALELSPAPFKAEANIGLKYQTQITPWGLPIVHAKDVWAVSKGQNVNVAVLDTGIDLQHPDLIHAYAGGYNVYAPAEPPQDDNKHGTHVSGIIAAADNAFGTVGIAPGVKLWAVKVLNIRGEGYDDEIVAGLDWVISKAKQSGGRWVINMSIGSRARSEVEARAIYEALENGIVVIAAAGNRDRDILDYPGRYQAVLAVGALDNAGNKADFSSYGIGLSVMAPGVDVPSTVIEGVNESADVQIGNTGYNAWGITGSPYATVTGPIVDCGLGYPQDFPASVAGKVALVKRGEIKFRDKARNAKDAGAAAIIIYNNDDTTSTNWNMDFMTCKDAVCEYDPGWENYQFILSIGVTGVDGEKLKALANPTATAAFRSEKYAELSGTSMATPHVTAIAALLLSLNPTLTPSDVRWALESTAQDKLEPGWDMQTGWGVADAFAAAKHVAPQKFGLPQQQQPPRRQSVRH
ncbi:MAG TPA: S8 family serine peptidase [Thermoanaerobaculia bacterium]|nr:S8 family serine peptidase [Thermoanaerobaculia bacterium]